MEDGSKKKWIKIDSNSEDDRKGAIDAATETAKIAQQLYELSEKEVQIEYSPVCDSFGKFIWNVYIWAEDA